MLNNSIKNLINIKPLSKLSFAPFGDVIETQDSDFFLINQGSTKRFHQLSTVDTADESGSSIINIFQAKMLQYPLQISLVERHPLGSQAFIPLCDTPFLIVVAQETKTAAEPHFELQAFISNGQQGINYAKNTWHHPILALKDEAKFLVIDRAGAGNNCVEHHFDNTQPTFIDPKSHSETL